MKSLSVAVAWPAWDWIKRPERRFLFASYAQTLSTRDSLKCRRLVQSPWYQQHWAGRFQLADDQNLKMRFDTDRGGYRLATSVGGALTGEGGDIIVIDDPHNASEAESQLIRESTLDWWDQAMSTRLNNPKTGAYVVVMQRVHDRDLTGHILAKDHGWDHLCLPMRYEVGHPFKVRSSLGWSDPRTKDGELLWPERIGEREAQSLEVALGQYGTAGQLQQRPAIAGGNILRDEWWKRWGKGAPPSQLTADQVVAWRAKEAPECREIMATVDTAYSAKSTADYSACTVWGLWTDANGLDQLMMLGAWRDRVDFPSLKRQIVKIFAEYDVDHMLIEAKASGTPLIHELRRQRIYAIAHNPRSVDKVTRANAVTAILEAGVVWAPERKWADEVIGECSGFPTAANDDYVDTVIMALERFRAGGSLIIDADRETDDPWQAEVDRQSRESKGPLYA